MPGITAALLGDLGARRAFGKVGTQSDIHLHDVKENGRDVTVVVPDRHPERVQPLSYAVPGADAGVLAVRELNAALGESVVAADAAGLSSGVVLLTGDVVAEQVAPLLAGTKLAAWPIASDAAEARAAVAAAEPAAREGAVMVPVDHHFNVKGVGAVVLGVVKQGVLRKGDTLHAFPDKVICPVRSIQIHDVDHNQAVAGDRVGLALRNTNADHLDRGMVLAPADAPLRVVAEGDELAAELARSRFARSTLASGTVAHLGVGMQFVPVRIEEVPAPGAVGALRVVAQKRFVHAPGERAVLWHVDAGAQRCVGGLRLP